MRIIITTKEKDNKFLETTFYNIWDIIETLEDLILLGNEDNKSITTNIKKDEIIKIKVKLE
ncbi:MAG: hypothetical protein ACFFG0_04785 [Candidatus Thorarchaeota archaeon]